jgi:hypothetical protein
VLRVLVPAAVLGVVLAVFFGAVSDIGKQSASYRRTVDRGFASLAGSVAIESAATGASLQSILTNGPSLDRITFFSTLDTVATQTAHQTEDLISATSPAPAATVGACRQALDDRAAAASDLRQAFEGALGGRTGSSPISPEAALSEADSGVAMAAQGDLAWTQCQQDLSNAPGRPKLAASTWLTDPTAWSGLWVSSLLPQVTGSPSLAANSSLGILAVSTNPSVLVAGGTPVLPATNALTVHVVVSNTGNVDQPGVRVTANLAGGRVAGPSSLSAFVALPAGRSMAIVLGPFAVVPGAGYTLSVTASPPSGAGTATSSLGLQVATVPTTTTTTTTTTPPKSRAPRTTP